MGAATPSEPFQLSASGSTRATAYAMANKSVRIGSLTHVTWLDAVAGVRVRTYNHDRERWLETVEVGDGYDNHTNPAMSASPDGQLRLAYGPHTFGVDWNQGRFKFEVSEKLNDASSWKPEANTGYNATYASLVTGADGRDHLVYRGGPEPKGTFYERRSLIGAWDITKQLSRLAIPPQYTNLGSNVMVDASGTVYCGFHYYAKEADCSPGVCVLKSPDGGETWTGMNDEPVKLPLAFDRAFSPPQEGDNVYLGSLAIDAEGNLVCLSADLGASNAGVMLSVFRGGKWEATRLNDFMPGNWRPYLGNATVDARGRILAVVSASEAVAEKWFGDPSLECFLLASDDGGRSFEAHVVSTPSPDVANWLPNISRTGPNHDLTRPLIIYTQGVKGVGCLPPDRTEVYAVWVD